MHAGGAESGDVGDMGRAGLGMKGVFLWFCQGSGRIKQRILCIDIEDISRMRRQAPEGVLGRILCRNPGNAGMYGLASRMTAYITFSLFRPAGVM